MVKGKAKGENAKKGKTNNPNGRPKGATNKVTGVAKERLLDIFEKIASKIEAEYILDDKKFKELDPRTLFKLFADILPYIIPKAEPNTDTSGQDNLIQTLATLKEVFNSKG